MVDAILVGDDLLQQFFQEFTAHLDRLETEVLKLGVLGVVVVLLHLGARVRTEITSGFKPIFLPASVIISASSLTENCSVNWL